MFFCDGKIPNSESYWSAHVSPGTESQHLEGITESMRARQGLWEVAEE